MTTAPAPAVDSWALVQAAQAGDMDAYAQLYRAHRKAVYEFIRFRVYDLHLSDDLTSMVFLRGLRAIRTYRWDGTPFVACLITIARNLIIDHTRAGRTRFEFSVPDVLDINMPDISADANPEQAAAGRTLCIELRNALSLLTDAQRSCLDFRFLQGLSVLETGRAMDLGEGAVKALQYRALKALARRAPHLHPAARP